MNKTIKDYEKHFIFNTLNTIKYFCRVDNEKATELVAIFANLLNYMIFDERKNVSILEELELLSHMKYIQQIRFNNEVILIKEKVEDIEIPKGIVLYIMLLGYSLNILRGNRTKIKINIKDKVIKIKITSNLALNIEVIKQDEFFQKIYEKIINLNCKLNLYVNENELDFDIFL